MRYIVEVTIEDAEQSIELDGAPVLPLPGDTVELIAQSERIVGILQDRHFAFEAPDVCRVALACKRL